MSFIHCKTCQCLPKPAEQEKPVVRRAEVATFGHGGGYATCGAKTYWEGFNPPEGTCAEKVPCSIHPKLQEQGERVEAQPPVEGWAERFDERFNGELWLGDKEGPLQDSDLTSDREALKSFIATLIASAERKGEVRALEWVLAWAKDIGAAGVDQRGRRWVELPDLFGVIKDRLAALTHGTGEK